MEAAIIGIVGILVCAIGGYFYISTESKRTPAQ